MSEESPLSPSPPLPLFPPPTPLTPLGSQRLGADTLESELLWTKVTHDAKVSAGIYKHLRERIEACDVRAMNGGFWRVNG